MVGRPIALTAFHRRPAGSRSISPGARINARSGRKAMDPQKRHRYELAKVPAAD